MQKEIPLEYLCTVEKKNVELFSQLEKISKVHHIYNIKVDTNPPFTLRLDNLRREKNTTVQEYLSEGGETDTVVLILNNNVINNLHYDKQR